MLATVATLGVMTDAALFRGRYIITSNVPNASRHPQGRPGADARRQHRPHPGLHDRAASGVEIRLEIEGEYPIPKDSRVEIKASGLLGGMVADVIPGSSSEPAKWGDRIAGSTGVGLFDKMDELAGEADKVAIRVQGLLSDQMIKDLQGGALRGARARSRACRRS